MKVAVSSKGEAIDSEIDPRFGRAHRFVLVDTETGESRAIDNDQNMSAAQGAGIQAAESVSRHDIEYVITGHCGPKAFKALEAAGIKVVTGVAGTVAEAVEKLVTGNVTSSDNPNVEGHW